MRTQPGAATGFRAASVAAREFGETITYQRNDAIHRGPSIGAVGFDPEHIARPGTERHQCRGAAGRDGCRAIGSDRDPRIQGGNSLDDERRRSRMYAVRVDDDGFRKD
jgi:hypothetical protein